MLTILIYVVASTPLAMLLAVAQASSG